MSDDRNQKPPAPEQRAVSPDNRIESVHFRESQRFGGADVKLWAPPLKLYGYTATLTQLGVRFSNDERNDAFTVPLSAETVTTPAPLFRTPIEWVIAWGRVMVIVPAVTKIHQSVVRAV